MTAEDEEQEANASSAPMVRRQPATIYDIARATGVSPSTVSRALNKPGRINATTERRIKDAAAALDYRFNPMARALPTGRTRTIGLLLSDITNPVYFDLVRGAERFASAQGYTLVIAESQESPAVEAETAGRLVTSVDGLVLVSSRLTDEAILKLSARKPMVLVNRQIEGVPSIVPTVGPGICAALDHLAELGHAFVGFLAGPSASYMNSLRWQTLLEQATRRGMGLIEIGSDTAPTLTGGRASLVDVLDAGVTAVIAYNDLMAIGLLQACRDTAVTVPGRLSIIGFDDIFGSDLTTPALTTIRTPLGLVGEEATACLIAGFAPTDHKRASGLETEFILRESTAAPLS